MVRVVKISRDDLKKLRILYESLMSHASRGLFYHEGRLYGTEIGNLALKDRDKYFDIAARVLVSNGWVEKISFEKEQAIAIGSIEASDEPEVLPTCYRMRGIVCKLYEIYHERKMQCYETECESIGSGRCVFELVIV